MPLGIDPLVDYVFKRLFADPANSDLLIHLLNAVLQFKSPIVEVEILNPFNEKEFADDKLTVLDVKARCGDGRWYNIEVQRRRDRSLFSRLAYYVAGLYADQLFESENYRNLKPAITICFLGETLFPQSPAPHLKFTLSDPIHQVEFTDQIQVHTIELPKYTFVKELLKTADELTRWSFFLREAESLNADELKQLLPEPAFVKAAEVVEMIAQTPEERMRYQARLKAERDHRWLMQLGIEEAREKALKEGREEGREEGLEKGRLVGQIQLLQKILKDPVSPHTDLEILTVEKLLQQCEQLQLRQGFSVE